MKYVFILLAAVALGVVISMAFPGATIWQVALIPVAVVFVAVTSNLIKGT